MLDLRFFRENQETIRAGIARKKFSCDLDVVMELDERRRTIIRDAEEKRAAQKAANAEMAKLDKGSDAFKAKLEEMRGLAQQVKALQSQQAEVETEWDAAYLAVPNIPDPSVPDGESEDDNVVFHSHGDVEAVSPDAAPHYDISWFSHYVDLERGTKITGAGWPVFRGQMARLVRSLLDFFLEENTRAGFEEIHPPLCVNPASAMATGALPDKEGQMYHVLEDNLYLIPTAEVPVTNFYRDEVVSTDSLPLKACAYSPCFRREAGSYGKDVRGLNRVHQFDKVELVEWVHPEKGAEALEELREHIQMLVEKLGLPYRTLLMCSKDIGFPHAKQYDVEVWAGGQKRWLEVSSASWFTDFQARRANIRFRDENGKLQVVHTLNGSGLAIPRVLAAILENNLQADGSVLLPDALVPHFGSDRLTPPGA
ncbi:serine--tRNA ligase [Puniceicoccales bacterium CK1056]|uniref:Serine--tRNA ligase n=1 Tax=Oceanipulchritudo coccoides TaxID=2706888 RepID=A0A6B2LXP0_9BACT|nr:serine--tRNA ligase [Oceanipulchritudo coccoides]NDV61368.1 serine--tRNA ligase [Oceanipulchritudo coccoides]